MPWVQWLGYGLPVRVNWVNPTAQPWVSHHQDYAGLNYCTEFNDASEASGAPANMRCLVQDAHCEARVTRYLGATK